MLLIGTKICGLIIDSLLSDRTPALDFCLVASVKLIRIGSLTLWWWIRVSRYFEKIQIIIQFNAQFANYCIIHLLALDTSVSEIEETFEKFVKNLSYLFVHRAEIIPPRNIPIQPGN